ncbi:MAG: HAD family hydrolase [Spirochaetes bacterium]|nr:HAD family hydrolase [Spirochaetota bacterium]
MTCLAFDIDGTLFDCGDIIIEAFQKGIALFMKNAVTAIEMPSKDKIISVLGIPTDLIFEQLFPDLNAHDQLKINDLCVNALADMIHHGGGSLYEHVYSTLERLHNEGYSMYSASNGKIKYIQSILESNGLINFFKKPVIVLNSKIKTKSEIIRYYKTNLSINDLMIMIGDRSSDRQAAEENNIPFIGCAFGHAGFRELDCVRWIASDFSKIYNIVKEIEKEYNIKRH